MELWLEVVVVSGQTSGSGQVQSMDPLVQK